jgi:hypothetical protein
MSIWPWCKDERLPSEPAQRDACPIKQEHAWDLSGDFGNMRDFTLRHFTSPSIDT